MPISVRHFIKCLKISRLIAKCLKFPLMDFAFNLIFKIKLFLNNRDYNVNCMHNSFRGLLYLLLELTQRTLNKRYTYNMIVLPDDLRICLVINLNQQFANRYVAPLGHIILIKSRYQNMRGDCSFCWYLCNCVYIIDLGVYCIYYWNLHK
jgi:hypothetical protein